MGIGAKWESGLSGNRGAKWESGISGNKGLSGTGAAGGSYRSMSPFENVEQPTAGRADVESPHYSNDRPHPPPRPPISYPSYPTWPCPTYTTQTFGSAAVQCCLLYVVSCLLSLVCCLLHVPRCTLHAPMAHAADVACRVGPVARRTLPVVGSVDARVRACVQRGEEAEAADVRP